MKIGYKHQFLSHNAENVWAAGRVTLENGKVKSISNLSGHYQPNLDEALTFPELFRGVGLEVTGAELNIYKITQNGSYISGTSKPFKVIKIK